MSNKKSNLKIFNQAIQDKLKDDQWNNLIVQKINVARKKNNRKWIQLALLPFILLTATSVFYIRNEHGQKSPQIAKKIDRNPHSSKNTVADNKNDSFKIHIMDVVFSKLQ